MRYCHNVVIRVFVKHDEDKAKIHQTLVSLLPFDLEKKKVKIITTKALSADERTPILISEITLNKDRLINAFLKHLCSNLKPDQKQLLMSQTNRLDDQGYFYLRFDKLRLIEGIYWLTDSGNCFHIRLCIASYPKTKENCFERIREIFILSDSD